VVTGPDSARQQGPSPADARGRTVSDIARAVVAGTAPGEAAFFDELHF
jgi:hypothetical protein